MRFDVKPPSFDFRAVLLAGTALASFLVYPAHATAPAAASLPQSGTVVAGSAKIIVKSNKIIVKETSESAIIDWASFNIGVGDKVIFIQPNQMAQILNEVAGSQASQILGQLKANGTVILTNPNGILFGPNADVNVKAIIATTSGITHQNFMSGALVFNIASNSSTASVVNLGTITAKDAGLVGLVAPGVENSGIIQAQLGTVQLVSGNLFTIDLYGDKLIKLAVNDRVLGQVAAPDGTALSSAVANHGLIEADGGTVILSAQAARNVVSSVINMDGVINARTVGTKNGEVVLNGGTSATVQVAGKIDASASGTGNGGTISIKGNNTIVSGSLNASAGANGGNGGQIETSGATLDIDGVQVSTAAPHGTPGNWLLDPYDLTIDASAATSIENALATGGVTLQTTATSATTAFGGTTNASGEGDINIDAPITWNANTILTLDAYNNVNVNANITANGATAGLTITYGAAGNFLTGAGASVTLSGTNAALTINGSPFTLIRTASQLQNMPNNGNFALANDIDLSGITNFSPLYFYSGTFEGLGHAVSNLTVNSSTLYYLGLFGYLDLATARNLSLTNVSITGGQTGAFLAMLAGDSDAIISNVSVSGTVTSTSTGDYIGGLVGSQSAGSISDSHATGTVTADLSSSGIGGLAGINTGPINNSYFSGTVSSTDFHIGGLVGNNSGSIDNSYATGSVIGGAPSYQVGGLVGSDNGGAISNSYFAGDVTGGSYVGGLVGDSQNAPITNSYATGTVTGGIAPYSGSDIGGLVGENSSTITNSYATNTVNAGDNAYNIGGLVGQSGYSPITNSYATGAIIAGNGTSVIGGLVGYNTGFLSGTISGSYATGSITAGTGVERVGGLLGQSEGGTITNNYSSSPITVGGNSSFIGGLIGQTFEGTAVSNSYAIGSITTGPNALDVGGLMGAEGVAAVETLGPNTLTASYATGSINAGAGSQNVAGLVGSVISSTGTVSSSYWDTTTTGQTNGCSSDPTCGGGATALGGANPSPYAQASYAGFDFTNTWFMVDGFTRPFLRSEYSTTITNAHQLQLIDLNLSANYTLANDVDMSELTNPSGLWNTTTGFSPLGWANTPVNITSFSGTFDGLGHAVLNLTINGNSLGYLGLFSEVTGTVQNLSLLEETVTASPNLTNIGGMAGQNSGVLLNDYVAGSISGSGSNWEIGGLAGFNLGSIENSYSTASVNGGNSSIEIGGLTGFNFGSIANSYFSGNVTGGSSASEIGGIAGSSDAPITNSYATGTVTGGDSSSSIGGLVGVNLGNITGSYATNTVYGGANAYNIGGLIGENLGIITNSYATNSIVAGDNTSDIGGLVGQDFYGTTTGSYAAGTILAGTPAYHIGGLVGYTQGSTISDSYSSTSITAAENASYNGGFTGNGGYIGGLVGQTYDGTSISNSYAIGPITTGPNVFDVGGLVGKEGLYSGDIGPNTITTSYATGSIKVGAGSTFVGGFAGDIESGGVASSYWDTATTGQNTGCGDTACTGMTALGGANPSPYAQASYAGFDFTNTWFMVDGFTRPFLRSEYSTTITNAHQLQLIDLNLSANYTLANDIDMSELTNPSGLWNTATGFVPIGFTVSKVNFFPNAFTGRFDGLGHIITNLVINNDATNYLGLFSLSNGTIQNLTLQESLTDSVTTAEETIYPEFGNIGLLTGSNIGTITNVNVIGSITGFDAFNIGGIAGSSSGTINNSTANVMITAADLYADGVGGLVGINTGKISYSASLGNVTAGESSESIGGLAGSSSDLITNSYATGNVTVGAASSSIGGLVGATLGTVTNSYAANTVNVNGPAGAVGGLAGNNDFGTISYSNFNGTVSTGDKSQNIGGLVGFSTGPINNSYASGIVITGANSFYIGGAVGDNFGATISNINFNGLVGSGADADFIGGLIGNSSGPVSNSYAFSTVTSGAGSNATGGLIGYNNGATINNSYANGLVITGDNSWGTGGLVGSNWGIISNSHEASDIKSGEASNAIGALVGDNVSIVTSSYATGAVTTEDSSYSIGNLVGVNGGQIDSAYATGHLTTTSNTKYVGGLVGQNNGSITNSYSSGSVIAGDYGTDIGGLVGSNNGTINNSYETGSITSGNNSLYVGSFAGGNNSISTLNGAGIITNSYAVGQTSVGANSQAVGGFVGSEIAFDQFGAGTITSSYWDTSTTGQTSGCGGDPTCGGGATGLTTQQWLTQGPAATNAAGWDFVNTWVAGYPYPVLKSLPYIVVASNPATKVYGTTNPAITVSSITDQNGANASGLVNTSALSWLTVPVSTDVGTYNVGGTGATAEAGYQITYDGSLTITPKALEICGCGIPTTKVYDGTTSVKTSDDVILAATEAFGAGAGDDERPYAGTDVTLSGTPSAVYNSPSVGTGKTITISGLSLTGAQAKDYTLILTKTGTITPAPETPAVTSEDIPAVQPAILSASYYGFVPGDNAGDFTGAPHAPHHKYDVTTSGASDTNYAIHYVDGTITIQPVHRENSKNFADWYKRHKKTDGWFSASLERADSHYR